MLTWRAPGTDRAHLPGWTGRAGGPEGTSVAFRSGLALRSWRAGMFGNVLDTQLLHGRTLQIKVRHLGHGQDDIVDGTRVGRLWRCQGVGDGSNREVERQKVKSERLKSRNQNKAIVVCCAAGLALVPFLPPYTNVGHLGARADPWNWIASTATAMECFHVSLEGLHFNCRPRSGRVETKMCLKCARNMPPTRG